MRESDCHGDVVALGVPDSVEEAVRAAATEVGRPVTTAANPSDAPDGEACVVCGHEPGRFDGIATLPSLSSTPVVFVPTTPDPSVATAAVERDVDAYLPVDHVREDPSALADAVADVVGDEVLHPTDGGVTHGEGADAGRSDEEFDASDNPVSAFDLVPGVPDALGDVVSDPTVAEQLLDLTHDAAFVADVESLAIVYANRAAGDVLGYDPGALRGVHVTELHPTDAGELLPHVDGLLDVDGPVERRFADIGGLELLTADGDTIPVAMRFDTVEVGDRTLVTAAFRDVTDRKARIEELERTERRLRNVTEAAFDIVFRLDASGEFQTISGTVAEVLGYDPDEVVGKSFIDLVADEYAEQAIGAFEAATDGERFEGLGLHLETADGRRRVAKINAIPVVVDGEFRGLEGAARDVTHERRRERLLSVLNRVLRHNVRNAATVLLGHLDALATDGAAAEDRHLNAIRETVDDLVTLGEKSTRLRRAARNRDDTDDVDPVAASRRAVEYADADVEVEVDDAASATVTAGGELEFLVRELVTNAVEHTGDATAVRVRDADDAVVVAVADDGDGIPRQERLVLEGGDESALEHGSGLGLWLVNWIATGAGGQVTVDTGSDGTTVEVRLPKPDP